MKNININVRYGQTYDPHKLDKALQDSIQKADLTSLTLINVYLSRESFTKLLSCIERSSLTSVNFSKKTLNSSDFSELLSTLARVPSLEEAVFQDCTFSDEDINAISSFLSTCTSLKSIDFSLTSMKSRFPQKHQQDLTDAILNHRHLETINVKGRVDQFDPRIVAHLEDNRRKNAGSSYRYR